jgi:hypothetical protein
VSNQITQQINRKPNRANTIDELSFYDEMPVKIVGLSCMNSNKIKNKKYHIVGAVQNPIEKSYKQR